MVKEVGKRAEAVILMMMNTLAGILGHVHRQWAVRTKQAEAQNGNLMQSVLFPLPDLGNR